MSDKALLFTGAGGFIGRYILAHYLEEPACDLYLLEHGRFRERLESYLDAEVSDPTRRSRIKVVSGDLRQPRLGLDEATVGELHDKLTHAVHLAALYNLAAPRGASIQVNVEGTRNVLDLLEGARSLERFGYVSTVVVVGTHTGVFREDELDVGQRFKNYYEETKYMAEQLVRERASSIPTAIFRPASVVGHSRTGAIEKIDGPYYALGMIARNMHRMVPATGDIRFQFVPVDFIADAVYHLLGDDEALGKTFHLVDPEPLRFVEFFDRAAEAMGHSKPAIKLPAGLMRHAGKLPLFERITGVPPEAFEHSFYDITFDTSNAAPLLARHGISCPRVGSYLDVMVDYFLSHAEDPAIRRGDWRQVTT